MAPTLPGGGADRDPSASSPGRMSPPAGSRHRPASAAASPTSPVLSAVAKGNDLWARTGRCGPAWSRTSAAPVAPVEPWQRVRPRRGCDGLPTTADPCRCSTAGPPSSRSAARPAAAALPAAPRADARPRAPAEGEDAGVRVNGSQGLRWSPAARVPGRNGLRCAPCRLHRSATCWPHCTWSRSPCGCRSSVTTCEVVLLDGPCGWGEFGPFLESDPTEAARWLAAAEETAWEPWPMPCAVRAGQPTVPAVRPEGWPTCWRGSRALLPPRSGRGTGPDAGHDLDRVAAVREGMGPSARVRVDANGAWSVDEAVEARGGSSRSTSSTPRACASVEELRDLRQLLARSAIDVPVPADESIRRADDPMRFRDLGEADIVVVKVAPFGGIGVALAVVEEVGSQRSCRRRLRRVSASRRGRPRRGAAGVDTSVDSAPGPAGGRCQPRAARPGAGAGRHGAGHRRPRPPRPVGCAPGARRVVEGARRRLPPVPGDGSR